MSRVGNVREKDTSGAWAIGGTGGGGGLGGGGGDGGGGLRGSQEQMQVMHSVRK